MLPARTHLLIERLFFFAPKRPCRNKIGEDLASETGFSGWCSSYAKSTVSVPLDVNRRLAVGWHAAIRLAGANNVDVQNRIFCVVLKELS